MYHMMPWTVMIHVCRSLDLEVHRAKAHAMMLNGHSYQHASFLMFAHASLNTVPQQYGQLLFNNARPEMQPEPSPDTLHMCLLCVSRPVPWSGKCYACQAQVSI